MDKHNLRKIILAQRRQLTSVEQAELSHKICHHLVNSAIFKSSQHIASYIANQKEVDPKLTIEQIWKAQKNCYLPLILSSPEAELCFMPYLQTDKLIANRFDISEPLFDPQKVFPIAQLDLIIMPLVAFDKQGHRLGMGAGYYDRTLALYKQNISNKKPYLLGMAYQFQQVEQLLHDPWDIPLHGIVTEHGIMEFTDAQT